MNIELNKIGEQFNNLDPQNIGNWPILVRSLIVLAVCGALIFAGYYFDTQEQQLELKRAQDEETSLKGTFETKQKKAASLDAYKLQMKEMEESFGTMLRQLPSKNEVADLLVDITQTGLASGLEFRLFKPNKESPREFYAELPISVEVSGDYHELGAFVGGIAALPRIVSLHDITITAGQSTGLSMKATAKTYRYLDEDELAAGKKKASSKRKKR